MKRGIGLCLGRVHVHGDVAELLHLRADRFDETDPVVLLPRHVQSPESSVLANYDYNSASIASKSISRSALAVIQLSFSLSAAVILATSSMTAVKTSAVERSIRM